MHLTEISSDDRNNSKCFFFFLNKDFISFKCKFLERKSDIKKIYTNDYVIYNLHKIILVTENNAMLMIIAFIRLL